MKNQTATTINCTTVVFIDAGVDNYQQLVAGVIPGATVFVLDKNVDGVKQISQVLPQYPNINTVHIISHGAPGCLYLGNTQLSLDTLKNYAAQLQQWKITNLLLYGCNVAAGDAGAELLRKLENLTRANIAASAKLTGNRALGGDWELEVSIGQAELSAVLNSEVMTSYQGIFGLVPVLVKDIASGANSSDPFNLTNVNGTLYFRANEREGNELWKSDGTEQGTVLVKNILSGSGYSPDYKSYVSLTSVNGTLYFRADDGINGFELWKSDGTANGTVMVKDIASGANSSDPFNLTNFNSTLYFTASNGINGYELWKSDGTANGTVMVKDIYSGSSSSSPGNLTNFNGTLYFRAFDRNGYELWKSDGTANGTVMVKDIYSGSGSSGPSNLTNFNGTLYFTASDGIKGFELWKSDGTANGTVLVKDILSTGSSNPNYLTNINSTLYFTASNGINGYELWKSDGTANGTVLVKDIYSGLGSSNPSNLTNVNGALYFTADDGINGYELWKSDGTANGTVMVKDIFSGSTGSLPYNLTNVNGTLYFTANDDINGYELWKSDGTANGTVMVKDIFSGSTGSFPYNLTNVNGTLYFTANDDINGNELWTLVNNNAPTDLSLSNTNIDENVADNTTVGTFTSTDLDMGDIFTYSLVTGIGDTDNTAFSIANNELKINASPNFETKSLYNIRVRTTDKLGESFDKNLTVNINNVNETPTNLTLSNNSINENIAASSTVGTFSSTDPDTGNTFTYSLVTGTGSTDNAAFSIVNSELRINASPNFEAKSSYNIRVRTTDQGGLSFEKEFTVNINDVDEYIRLTPNNDVYRSGAGDDQIDGLAGDDVLYGNAGNDEIFGSDGNDVIYGGNDNDTISGGNGSDRLYGDAGNDNILGDAGNDILYGGDGDDILNGGAGSDQLYGNNGRDTFVLASGMGQDIIYGFQDGLDLMQLNGGLTFDGLKIVQSGTSTLIKVLATGETIASLMNTSSTLIDSTDFSFGAVQPE